jgi:hypothetical protein
VPLLSSPGRRDAEASPRSAKTANVQVFTPSFQYGTIREGTEPEFRRALLANDFVAKDVLIHCLPGVELACPFYVMFKSFAVKVGAKGEDDRTSDLFYDVVADKVMPSSGRVEVPAADRRYYFLKTADLVAAGRFPRFQEVRDRLILIEPDDTCLFVTHDWQSPPEAPDPHNIQYGELAALLKGGPIAFHSQPVSYEIGTRTFIKPRPPRTEKIPPARFQHVWVDYSCMPQRPRDASDEKLFRAQLTNLNNIFRSGIRVVRIGDKERQRTRSWCVLEQELAKANGGINSEFKAAPTEGIAGTQWDAIFELSVAALRGTKVTEADDRKIVEWMLYKSITDVLTRQPR